MGLGTERAYEDVLYVKASDWSYEREWRLHYASGSISDHADYTFLPQILDGLYLGCRMPKESRSQLIELMKRNFPHASIWVPERLSESLLSSSTPSTLEY